MDIAVSEQRTSALLVILVLNHCKSPNQYRKIKLNLSQTGLEIAGGQGLIHILVAKAAISVEGTRQTAAGSKRF